MESKVDSIGDKIDQGNEKNEKIFNQLLEHHLGIKQSDNTNKWKLLSAVFGGGGLLSGIAIDLFNIIYEVLLMVELFALVTIIAQVTAWIVVITYIATNNC